MFRLAIVRPPSASFARGITTAALGLPDLAMAELQHRSYCQALESCGLRLIALGPDAAHPDSTFVEDTAVITVGGAMLTRPGAPSRLGEVDAIRVAVEDLGLTTRAIEPPGTLDGGDVCEAEDRFFIGVSERTNEAGALQLAAWLADGGRPSTLVDIRGRSGLLHLKSGLGALDGRRLVCDPALADDPAFEGFEIVRVAEDERYGANCVLVNRRVLLPSGCPRLERALAELGYPVVAVEMSEFRKMDGGPSCLSLRVP